MIEQIKEYLVANDVDVVLLGYELLKSLELSDEEKSKIMIDCGYITVGRMYWTLDNHSMKGREKVYAIFSLIPLEWSK